MKARLTDVAWGAVITGCLVLSPRKRQMSPPRRRWPWIASASPRLGVWLRADKSTGTLPGADPSGDAGKGWPGKAKVTNQICHSLNLSRSK